MAAITPSSSSQGNNGCVGDKGTVESYADTISDEVLIHVYICVYICIYVYLCIYI
jgi:hypothetical protein